MDKITKLVTEIATIKRQMAPLEAKLAPLKESLDEAKFELMLVMQETKSKRTESVNGYFAVRAERSTFRIEDEQAVKEWLLNNRFDMEDYMAIDKKRVEATAEATRKETGEIVPGVGMEVNEYITLKKDKPDA